MSIELRTTTATATKTIANTDNTVPVAATGKKKC